MIQMQTSLAVADNSGAKRVEMIAPIGGSTAKIARLGDKIKVTVKEASPDGTAKKGKVYNAVIVRTRKEVRRKLGRFVRTRWFQPPFSGIGFAGLIADALKAMESGPGAAPIHTGSNVGVRSIIVRATANGTGS